MKIYAKHQMIDRIATAVDKGLKRSKLDIRARKSRRIMEAIDTVVLQVEIAETAARRQEALSQAAGYRETKTKSD